MSIIDRIKIASTSIDLSCSNLPTAVKLELSGVCNHKCYYCVVPTLKGLKKFMPIDVVNKTIEEVKRLNIKEIGLFHMGEGTLHPQFCEIIDIILNGCNSKLFITTNGTRIDELKYLVKNNIQSIKFSLNGYNKETHLKATGVDTFDKIIENIKLLIKYRNDIISSTEISASSIFYNNTEQDDFVDKMSKIVDNYYFTEIYSHADKVINKYIDLTNNPRIINGLCGNIPCYGMYNLCHIKTNGDVNLCRWGVDDEFVIGNIMETPLDELWFSEKAMNLRNESLAGKLKTCNICTGIKNGI